MSFMNAASAAPAAARLPRMRATADPRGPRWLGALLAAAMIALPALVIHLTPGAAEALEWRRGIPLASAWWRPVTCHWVHWSVDHLTWDALAGAALAAGGWALAGGRRTAGCVALTAAASPLVLQLFSPEVTSYRGLSDIDSALFALLVATFMRLSSSPGERWLRIAALAMLAGIVAKTVYEVVSGATLFVNSAAAGFTPLPLVHGVGIAAGLVVGGWGPRASVPPRGAVL